MIVNLEYCGNTYYTNRKNHKRNEGITAQNQVSNKFKSMKLGTTSKKS